MWSLYIPVLVRTNGIDVSDDRRSAAVGHGNLGEIYSMVRRRDRWVRLKDCSACGVEPVGVAEELGDDKADQSRQPCCLSQYE